MTPEDTAKYRPKGVGDDNAHNSPARDSKLSRRENALVLYQYRNLREAERKVVNDKTGVESLHANNISTWTWTF